ncbi:MAG TPA: hypothetical protein VGG39_22935 [Polyangiaceae bacterium]|jgi:hypothetical protein
MKDPPRLLEGSASEYERLLLRAGRADAPAEARQRAIVAATAALGTTGLAVGAATSLAAKSASGLSLKWLAVVSLVGVGAVVGAAAIESHGRASASGARSEPTILVQAAPTLGASPHVRGTTGVSPRASATDVPSPVAPAAPVAPALGSASGTEMPAPAISGAPLPPPASAPSDVRSELRDLEDARAALAAGQPARALSLLDAYAASHPHATMASEATVIRIEALVRAGDHPAAERLAASFLASQPQSPYAERVRSLVGASNP